MSLRDSGNRLQGVDVAYFTASVDDAATNQKFAESMSLNYPILSDPSRETAKAFGVLNDSNDLARRWTYYIDRDGIIRYVDKDVDPRTAGPELVKRLQELDWAD